MKRFVVAKVLKVKLWLMERRGLRSWPEKLDIGSI